MLPLDVAAYSNRWRHRHPGEKALVSLGLLVLTLVLPTWPGALLTGGVALVLVLGPAGLEPRVLVRTVRVPLGFVLTGSLPLLVAVGGEPWLRWDPAGLPQAAQPAGRAVAALLCLLLFAATTPLADLLPRLHRLGVPPGVTEVAALTYRFLFLLLDSLRVVRDAQAGRLGFRSWRSSYRSLTGQGGAVFVRAFDRARRLEEGLAARGYSGSLRVQVQVRPLSPPFVATSCAVLGAVAATTLLLAA